MANLNGFNAREVEPEVGFEPIPAGKYLAIITGSEMKDTKAGTGRYLELTFEVIEGKHKGRNPSQRVRVSGIMPSCPRNTVAESTGGRRRGFQDGHCRRTKSTKLPKPN
ncbi:MAG: DUF669 domain-containing protein [Planctomycetota bacterium]